MVDNFRCTLICIINDKKIYDAFRDNLSTQKGVMYTLIPIFNLNNNVSGARNAFNEVLNQVQDEYVIFLHPDIRFLHEHSLLDLIKETSKIPQFGVIGVAGCPASLQNGKRIIYSSIVHGIKKDNAGDNVFETVEVQTVDECLFIMQKELVNNIRFSEKSGWHLYAVEQCLRCLRIGRKNYVVPADVWHLSDGKSLDPNYVIKIKDLLHEYSEYDYINTTVRKWSNKSPGARLFIEYYFYKQIIKRIAKRIFKWW